MFSVPLEDVEAKIANLQKLVAACRVNGNTHLDEAQCVYAAKMSQDLRNLVNPPKHAGHEIATMPYIVTAARLAIDLGIFKSLSSNSPQTADELASSAMTNTAADTVSASFIKRIMRLITPYGLATEVEYDIYQAYQANATTRAFAAPDEALQSLLVHYYDYYMPVAHHSISYFAEKGYALPEDPCVGPFQSYWKTDKPTYEYWLSQPPEVLERLNKLMQAVKSESWVEWMNAEIFIGKTLEGAGVDWPGPEQPILVDIAGGNGGMVHSIRKGLNEIELEGNIVLQERPAVIKEALYAAAELGYSSETGMPGVQYVSHDIFDPQPEECTGSLFYYMGHVLHNWNDEMCINILKQVAKAMKPKYSVLLINERLLQTEGNDLFRAGMDFHMGYSHASRERTRKEYTALALKAGMDSLGMQHSPDEGQDLLMFWLP